MEEDAGEEVDKIELSEMSPVAFWRAHQTALNNTRILEGFSAIAI